MVIHCLWQMKQIPEDWSSFLPRFHNVLWGWLYKMHLWKRGILKRIVFIMFYFIKNNRQYQRILHLIIINTKRKKRIQNKTKPNNVELSFNKFFLKINTNTSLTTPAQPRTKYQQKKKGVIDLGIEPRTYAVLRRRHNQLDQSTGCRNLDVESRLR